MDLTAEEREILAQMVEQAQVRVSQAEIFLTILSKLRHKPPPQDAPDE